MNLVSDCVNSVELETIARYDERIRVNGQNNDRCEADRE